MWVAVLQAVDATYAASQHNVDFRKVQQVVFLSYNPGLGKYL